MSGHSLIKKLSSGIVEILSRPSGRRTTGIPTFQLAEVRATILLGMADYLSNFGYALPLYAETERVKAAILERDRDFSGY